MLRSTEFLENICLKKSVAAVWITPFLSVSEHLSLEYFRASVNILEETPLFQIWRKQVEVFSKDVLFKETS